MPKAQTHQTPHQLNLGRKMIVTLLTEPQLKNI